MLQARRVGERRCYRSSRGSILASSWAPVSIILFVVSLSTTIFDCKKRNASAGRGNGLGGARWSRGNPSVRRWLCGRRTHILRCAPPTPLSKQGSDFDGDGLPSKRARVQSAALRRGAVQDVWPEYNVKLNKQESDSSFPLWQAKYNFTSTASVTPSASDTDESAAAKREFNVHPALREALVVPSAANANFDMPIGSILDNNANSLFRSQEEILSMAEREQMAEGLKRWLLAGGAEVSNVNIKEYADEVRGVETEGEIQRGANIIAIPEEYLLTDTLACRSEIGKDIWTALGSSPQYHMYPLYGYLLQEREKGEESFWWPYIRTLPRKFFNHPLTWEKADKQLMQGTFSLKLINRQLHQLKIDYEEIVKKVPGFGRFSYEDFIWAHLVISTRCYGAEIDGKKASIMAPLADMFNHELDQPGGTWGFDDASKRFIVQAHTDLPPNTQISVPYGGYSSSRLFTHYGFQTPGKRHYDAMAVVGAGHQAFELTPKYLCPATIRLFTYLRNELRFLKDEHPVFLQFQDKANSLQSLNTRVRLMEQLLQVPESEYTLGSNLSRRLPAGGDREHERLLEEIRKLDRETEERMARNSTLQEAAAMAGLLSDQEMYNAVCGNAQHKSWFGSDDDGKLDPAFVVSRENEERVLEEIRKACVDALMLFPTTLEKDIEALREYSHAMTIQQKNAIVASAGEKQTLMWFITLANIAIPLLQLSDPHIKLFVRRQKELKKDIYSEYINLIVKPLTKGCWPDDKAAAADSQIDRILHAAAASNASQIGQQEPAASAATGGGASQESIPDHAKRKPEFGPTDIFHRSPPSASRKPEEGALLPRGALSTGSESGAPSGVGGSLEIPPTIKEILEEEMGVEVRAEDDENDTGARDKDQWVPEEAKRDNNKNKGDGK